MGWNPLGDVFKAALPIAGAYFGGPVGATSGLGVAGGGSGGGDSGFNWSKLIEPAIGFGAGILQSNAKSGTMDSYYNFLKSQEDQKYQKGLANYQAYQDYLNQGQAASASASAASRAASAARSKMAAAYAAAQRQEQANAQKAAKKANRTEQRGYATARSYYDPYITAGNEILPEMTNTYKNALSTMNMFNGYLTSPAGMAALNQSIPAYQTNIPVPDYLNS